MSRVAAALGTALLALAMVWGCSGGKSGTVHKEQSVAAEIKVNTSHDPAVQFPRSAYWAWAGGYPNLPDDIRVDPVALEARLRNAIRRVMADKGYTFRVSGPQYRVGYRVAITTDKFSAEPSERYTVREGWIPAMAGARKMEEGALMIDIVDAQSHRLVWQGVCEGSVTMTADEQAKNERVNRAVEAILAEFPP